MTDTPTPEAVAAICPECDNTGLRDTGGIYPWGEGIFVPCDHNDPPPVSVTPEAVAAILKDVTPAPWLYRPDKHDDWGWVKAQGCVIAQVRHPDRIMDEELTEWRKTKQDPWEANARFVAWARNNVEALAADRDAQKARADAAKALAEERLQGQHSLSHQLNDTARELNAALAAAEAKVAQLAAAVKGLDGAARELVAAAEAMGMFDNILADFLPDQHVRGNRKADWLKRADAARNNVKAQSGIARAIIAEVQG